MPARNNWTREQHLLAFNLYCQIPFGKINKSNPKVIALANCIGRTPSAVGFKLGNFGRLDPALKARGVSGLAHGANGEEEIWNEFASDPERLAYESELLMLELEGRDVEVDLVAQDDNFDGQDREAVVKQRVNQGFFRKRVLAAYEARCCVTGLSSHNLLIASHIIPWSVDEANRLNPRNGLCLNALHDKAFDRGLMWIEDDLTVTISPTLQNQLDPKSSGTDWFMQFDRKQLVLPKHFEPDMRFLQLHAEKAKQSRS
jgi:putative restriction endonuclease